MNKKIDKLINEIYKECDKEIKSFDKIFKSKIFKDNVFEISIKRKKFKKGKKK